MIEFAIISAIAIATSLVIAFILNKFGINTRLREIQQFTNKVNMDYFDALRKKDMKRLDELEEKLKQSQKMSFETIGLQLKTMVVTLPIAFVLPFVLQHFLFPAFVITLPFKLPIPFRPTLFSLTWRDTFGAYGWYWLSFIFLGGSIQILRSVTQKKPAAKPAESGAKTNEQKK